MMLYCRLLGAVLLVCTGFAAGQAYCQRLWAQWRAVCGFERLLTYLADQLAFCALPSAELLAAAAEHPAFAAYCPPSAASFAELRLPPPLAKTCGAELHAGLHTIALCSRQQAPQTMRTLAALCHRTAQGLMKMIIEIILQQNMHCSNTFDSIKNRLLSCSMVMFWVAVLVWLKLVIFR